MTRLGVTACVSGILCLAVLMGYLDTQAGLYPSFEVQEAEAIADMVTRTAEHACGGEAIQTGRGLRCARDINPALVANAGETR